MWDANKTHDKCLNFAYESARNELHRIQSAQHILHTLIDMAQGQPEIDGSPVREKGCFVIKKGNLP